jgi:maltose O-acetyltransferase
MEKTDTQYETANSNSVDTENMDSLHVLSEYQKMMAGQHFNGAHPELIKLREAARLACAKYNAHPSKGNLKHIKRLFIDMKSGHIEPSFQCDYGTQIKIGERFFANFNCVILDSAQVTIGDDVLFGPGVHIYTVDHPRDAQARIKGVCFAKPVIIGNGVWIGGGAKILPGVTIADNVIVPANSVVSQSISK